MVWLTRIFVFIFIAAILLFSLAFMTANENKVSVDFFLWQATATTGVWMVIAFGAGLLITLLASYPVIVTYKFRLRRSQKKQLELQSSRSKDQSQHQLQKQSGVS